MSRRDPAADRVPDNEPWDAVVVGGGPAGATAAFFLASRGRRVLVLDRRAFPRDKSCGDGLTPRAVRILEELGAISHLEHAWRIGGVRVVVRGKGSEDFPYPSDVEPGYGLVVPRLVLDKVILERAAAVGAVVWENATAASLVSEDGRVIGVQVRRGEAHLTVLAAVTILAAGASSKLHQPRDHQEDGLGFALRTYVDGLTALDDRLEIYLPILDASDRYLLPSYGWVFPVNDRKANLGIGLFEAIPRARVHEMAERFLAERIATDGRFAQVRIVSRWRAAPLRFDFAPQRCAHPGLVLTGDAAGLVSPFTGEGISYAMESGRLAAEVIDRALIAHPTTPDVSEYALLLGHRYTGYFEVGRRSARRYRLVWHLVENTAGRRTPVTSLLRRALFFPEGVGELHGTHVLDDVAGIISPAVPVRDDLTRIGELLLQVVRREWPFLGPLWLGGHGDPGIPFRPALLLLLAAQLGNARAQHLHQAGAALEIGYLATLAWMSVEDMNSSASDVAADWGNMGAVIIGDFLLAAAYRLAAAIGAKATVEIAQGFLQACEGQVAMLTRAFDLSVTDDDYLAVLQSRIAPMFSLPCRLGAQLAGADPDHLVAVETFGAELGLAYALTDDVLQLQGRALTLGSATGADMNRGVYGLSLLKAARDPAVGPRVRALLQAAAYSPDVLEELRNLVEASPAMEEVRGMARRHAERAAQALEVLPEQPVRRSLLGLLDYALERRPRPRPDLRALLNSEG